MQGGILMIDTESNTTILVSPFYDDTDLWRITFDIRIGEGDLKIGSGHGILIPEYATDRHSVAIELSDRVTQDTYDVCAGFDPSCLSEDNITMRMVIIEKIEIVKKYRGNNYGLEVMNTIISFFSLFPGTVIILQPHPYGETGTQATIKKLQDHWKKCGFKQCKKTPYFFRECDFI
jgi:hypothetical protein